MQHTRHSLQRASATLTVAGTAVLIGGLIAVSHIPEDVPPATILQAAVGFLLVIVTIGTSAAVWALTYAFESVAQILSGVAAITAMQRQEPARPNLRVVERH